MSAPHVLEITAQNFEQAIMQSQQVPLLLDFWAEWCGPCKTLTPILEKLAAEYGGAFVLGKIDTEKEPELAQAFRVQSIPFVVVFSGGRPIDAFAGALPEPEIRAALAKAGIEPLDGQPESEADGDAARLLEAKQAVMRGDIDAARAALEAIEDENLAGERDRLRDGLVLFDSDLDPAASPAAESLLRARESLSTGRLEQAMESVLESIERDRLYADGLARRVMLLCFSLVGEDQDVCSDYRRRMATLLF